MKIALLTTGDEILQGIITDTNSAWLSQRCYDLGHEVVWHASVGDDEAAMMQALRMASSLAEVLIVTGGLGPTQDDITLEVAAKTFSKPLSLSDELLKEIEAFFHKRGRVMASSNKKQAYLPEGAKPLHNELGTAPGVHIQADGVHVFLLSGVPAEMKQMFDDSVAKWLEEKASAKPSDKTLRCYGIGESDLQEKLEGLNLHDCRLSFRVKFPEILLKVVSFSGNAEAVDKVSAEITKRLGAFVYGKGEEDLVQLVAKQLTQQKKTLALAESCTGGYLSHLLTNIPGASAYLNRTLVVYANQAKHDELGISEKLLKEKGAVSKEVALEMANALRKKSHADYALSLTGIAGPAGGANEKPLGTVYVALSSVSETLCEHFVFHTTRTSFKERAAWAALNILKNSLDK